MGLVHVPRGKDARFFTKRADQNRVTLEIDHADLTVSRQPQILSGNVHDNGKPFSVAQVPEHLKVGILGKELLTGGAEGFADVVFELSSIHSLLPFLWRRKFLIHRIKKLGQKIFAVNMID